MRLLILGGTVFLGRETARRAAAAGHDVTCAARGVSGPPAEGVRLVRVDRDDPAGLSTLDGQRFDAVIDVARRPSHVRNAVAALADRVGHWSFVSSCSAYADQATPGQTATTAPLHDAAPPGQDDPHGPAYGPCKVACEEVVVDAMGPDRSFLCRAGLIVGPGDPSGRFRYWVDRFVRGGEVLAPGEPTDLVQYVDVRDLAAWLVHAAETGLTGPYDGIGAPHPRSRMMAGLAAALAPAGTTVTWVDQQFLLDNDVEPWMGERALPLWLPLPEYGGFLTRDVSPSLVAGLRTRDVGETGRDTRDWLLTHPAAGATGLAAEDETNVLRRWHARAS